MTSHEFRSELRELILAQLHDWSGAARCLVFGRHAWKVVSIGARDCGGADVTICCPRCDEITVAEHFCGGEGHEGGGQGLPKPAAEHLRDATQPSPEMIA